MVGAHDVKTPASVLSTDPVSNQYRTEVISVNQAIAARLDVLTRQLVTARYGDRAWVTQTKRVLAGMHEDAARARAISAPAGFEEVHATWREGIDSYDGAATNLALAVEGGDGALMSGCAGQLEIASKCLRRAMVLLDQAEGGP
jgi:hypothetical protein